MKISDKGDTTVMGILILMLVITSSVVSAQPVLQRLSEHNEVSIFVDTIERAGLDSRLNSDGPYTIFAPSNRALQKIEDRLDRNSESTLRSFVLNHIITGMATKRQIKAMSKAPSLGGLVLNMEVNSNNDVIINDISVVQYNIRARNGVIHIIDGTLE